MSQLSQIDLNLLVALQALLRVRSVTKAAHQLNVTQSAMSRTLQRLRQQFNDPLFIRTKSGLVPTQRAESLSSQLDCLLQKVESLFTPTEFIPEKSNLSFRLMMSDFFSQVFMPQIYNDLYHTAPQLSYECLPRSTDLMTMLSKGEIDLGITTMEQKPQADIYAQILGQDKLVTLMSNEHLLANKPLLLEDYCAQKHMLITMGGDNLGKVDIALNQMGLSREVVFRIPHFTAAPHILAKRSDLLLTLPASIAQNFAPKLNLRIKTTPIELPHHSYYLIWHERQHNHLGHRWLRKKITNSFQENYDMSWLKL